jgi:hypothetical protein
MASPAPGRLHVSDDVAAIVGARDLASLQAKAAAEGYDCDVCRQHSTLEAEAAAVIVSTLEAGIEWARLAHQRCSPSAVVPGPPLPEEFPATAIAGVIPHDTGPRAVILTEPAARVSESRPPGDHTDLLAAWLLGHGMHLLARAGHLPPPAPGWSVRFPSPTTAVITGPGTDLYEGPLVRPPLWQHAAAARGGAELLFGVTGLAAITPDTSPISLLATAARAGRLIGGSVPV